MKRDKTDYRAYLGISFEMKKKFRHLGALALFALYGCTASADFCELTGDNYLQNSNFSAKTRSGSALNWTAVQHAGEPSFEVNYEGDEVTINKIGTQSWLMLKQRLRDTDLGGKKAAFTAEIKLRFATTRSSTRFQAGRWIAVNSDFQIFGEVAAQIHSGSHSPNGKKRLGKSTGCSEVPPKSEHRRGEFSAPSRWCRASSQPLLATGG